MVRRQSVRRVLHPAFLLLLFASTAAAQQAGAIAGVARDESGAVLPGVTVEAASPALIEKMRSAVTDNNGAYRIVDLRPGTYSVKFELPGFSTFVRDGVQLSEGFTAPVNAELTVGAVQETVTVAGAAPVVDVQGTLRSTVITREALTTIPTAQYFAMIGNLMPGVTGTGVGRGQDVGGNSGFSSVRMGIHGGRITDQQVYYGGFSIERAGGDGTTIVVPIEGAIEEYTMNVSGHSAEAEAGGIRINIVPKSGGNSFSAGFYGTSGTEDFQSNNVTPELEALGISTGNRAKSIWAISPYAGGPIKRDRLWFFAAFQRNVNNNYVASSWSNKRKDLLYEPDFSRPFVVDQDSHGTNVRLTFQLNDKHRFAGYYEDSFLCSCHHGGSSESAPEAVQRFTGDNRISQVNWTSPLTNTLLLEAGWGRADVAPYKFSSQPDSGPARVQDVGIGFTWGRSGNDLNTYLGRVDHYKASLAYFPGSHNFKVGFENRISSQQDTVIIPSGNFASYRFVNGVPDRVTYSTGPREQENWANNIGLFVQDRLTRGRLTADVGLRFDWLRTHYPDQTSQVALYRPVATSFSGADVLNWKDLNPRLGAAYDLFGDGKTAFKANLSRFVIQETVGITTDLNPVPATNASTTRSWRDRNGDLVVQGDPLNPAANGELGPGNNATFGQPGQITTRIDPNFAEGFAVRPYQWELTAGVERELFAGLALDATYFRRMFGSFQVTQNVALSPADYSPYCVTAPVDPRLPGGGGDQICGLYDLNPDARRRPLDGVITSSKLLSDEPQVERWTGVDLLVRTRLPRGIILQGGTSTGKTVTDNCAVVASIGDKDGNPSSLYCHTETPYLTSLRINGAYPLPWNSQVSAVFKNNSGEAITATRAFSNAEIAPSLGRNLSAGSAATINLVAPGTMFIERSNQLDVRFTKRLTIGKTRWQLSLDLYNALNAAPVVSLNNTYGSAWLRPTRVLAPRLAKFGIRVDY